MNSPCTTATALRFLVPGSIDPIRTVTNGSVTYVKINGTTLGSLRWFWSNNTTSLEPGTRLDPTRLDTGHVLPGGLVRSASDQAGTGAGT